MKINLIGITKCLIKNYTFELAMILGLITLLIIVSFII